jgi:hypothetical protein
MQQCFEKKSASDSLYVEEGEMSYRIRQITFSMPQGDMEYRISPSVPG